MRVKLTIICSFAAVTFLLWYTTSNSSYTSKKQALQDLAFIVNETARNHPGMHNAEDRFFAQHLRHQAYIARSRVLAPNTKINECKDILNTFTQSFNDGHFRIEWYNEVKKSLPIGNRSLTLNEVAPGIWWVTIPTFHNLSKKQSAEFLELQSKLPLIRRAKGIIFDLRGNKGGNSALGTKIVSALFGDTYCSYHLARTTQSQAIDWRATPTILDHVRWLKKYTHDDSFDEIAQGIAHSIMHKKPFFTETGDTTLPRIETRHEVSAHIACIIHHKNASAALNFIDDLIAMNYPISLIGQTTAADRLYMELRMVPLPSKKGKFCHPVKVYRNRPRKDNQPYHPTLFFDGDIHDTDTLKPFVLKALQ